MPPDVVQERALFSKMLAQVPKSVDIIFKCWTFGKLVTLSFSSPCSQDHRASPRFGQEFFLIVLLDCNV